MDFPLARAVASRLDVVPESESTNADLRSYAHGARQWGHLSVLVTKNQTAGRGRLDRRWETPAGSALAISVLLRDLPADQTALGWIPLMGGLAMAEAISAQLPAHDVGVKWPNDVLVDGQKISGILAEVVSGTEGGIAVILGAGVNTAMTAAQLPVPTATSFAMLGAEAREDQLLADYLRGLSRALTSLVASGDAVVSGLRDAVTERCQTLGREVAAHLPGGDVIRGTAKHLSPEGHLIIEVEGREHTISAADVVHLR